jgi:hypothetical protein
MSASIDYRLVKLGGTIEEVKDGQAIGISDAATRSIQHPHIRLRTPEGDTVFIDNVVVPEAIDAWLKPGFECQLYVVEAEANVCPPAHGGCVAEGPVCHIFAMESRLGSMSVPGNTAGYFAALKQIGVNSLLSWSGLALLVSFILIGIPFLIYFGVLALFAMATRIPTVGEMKRFLGSAGFPVRLA